MKTLKYIIIVVVCALAPTMTGCKSNLYNPTENAGRDVYFNVVASTTSTLSRAFNPQDVNFTSNSSMGVFALPAGQPDVEYADDDKLNIQYVNTAGQDNTWRVGGSYSPIKFLPNDQEMDFIAYHPHSKHENSSTSPDASVARIVYRTPESQSTLDELVAADLMWGNALNVKESDGVVNLRFAHKLSKLSFQIIQGGGWGQDDVMVESITVVGITGLSNTLTMNLSTGVTTIASQSSNTTITCTYADPLILDETTIRKCEFILIPTNATDLKIQVKIKDVEEIFEGQLQAVQLKVATQRNVNLILHRRDQLELALDAQIEPWEISSDIEVEGI